MDAKLERLHIDLPESQATSVPPSKSQPISTPKAKTIPTEVVDSWEDDADDDDDKDFDSSAQTPTESSDPSLSQVTSADNPALAPPPPTPISPQDWTPATVLGGGRPTNFFPTSFATATSPRTLSHHSNTSTPARSNSSSSSSERKRPEKSAATAGRMIAASLGIKAPPKTDEQRRYERAVKENEIRRRAREKEDRERERAEDEKAKDAVWDG